MKDRLLFNLLLILWLAFLVGCDNEVQKKRTDSRSFDKAHFEKLNTLDSYNYNRKFEEKSSESPLLDFLANIFSGIAWFLNTVFGYVIIALLIGLLIWILVKNSNRFFEKKTLPERDRLVIVDPVEVDDKDYSKLIKAALKKQNYRIAIRFGFLATLKHLHKKELIEWKIDKTNMDYQIELPESYQEHFNNMSLIYEQVWYGHFSANKELFDTMTRKLHDLKSLTQQTGTEIS